MNDRDRTTEPECIFLIGGSGVGKSKWVQKHYPGSFPVPHASGGTWFWQGYQYQDCCVFEEFKGENFCKYENFKFLLSCTPYTVNIKNGSASMNSSTFVFMTNYHPFEWYSHIDRDALYRRLREPWCRIYLIPQNIARANGGRLSIDKVPGEVMDRLYRLTGKVLDDYLALRPVTAGEEDKVVDYTVLRNFDIKAAKLKYGHPIYEDPSERKEEEKEDDVSSATEQLSQLLSPSASSSCSPPSSVEIISPPKKRARAAPPPTPMSLHEMVDQGFSVPSVFSSMSSSSFAEAPQLSPPRLVRQVANAGSFGSVARSLAEQLQHATDLCDESINDLDFF